MFAGPKSKREAAARVTLVSPVRIAELEQSELRSLVTFSGCASFSFFLVVSLHGMKRLSDISLCRITLFVPCIGPVHNCVQCIRNPVNS